MLKKNRDCKLCEFENTENEDISCVVCEDNSNIQLYEYKMKEINMANAETCVSCGDVIPESYQACSSCEEGHLTDYNKIYKEKKKFNNFIIDIYFMHPWKFFIGGTIVTILLVLLQYILVKNGAI